MPDQHVVGRAKFLDLGIAEAQGINLAAQFLDVGGLLSPDGEDGTTLEVDADIQSDKDEQQNRCSAQNARQEEPEAADPHDRNLGVIGNKANGLEFHG